MAKDNTPLLERFSVLMREFGVIDCILIFTDKEGVNFIRACDPDDATGVLDETATVVRDLLTRLNGESSSKTVTTFYNKNKRPEK